MDSCSCCCCLGYRFDRQTARVTGNLSGAGNKHVKAHNERPQAAAAGAGEGGGQGAEAEGAGLSGSCLSQSAIFQSGQNRSGEAQKKIYRKMCMCCNSEWQPVFAMAVLTLQAAAGGSRRKQE